MVERGTPAARANGCKSRAPRAQVRERAKEWAEKSWGGGASTKSFRAKERLGRAAVGWPQRRAASRGFSDGEALQSAVEATFRLAMTCDILTRLMRFATRIL
jgi:hypothetical protein